VATNFSRLDRRISLFDCYEIKKDENSSIRAGFAIRSPNTCLPHRIGDQVQVVGSLRIQYSTFDKPVLITKTIIALLECAVP
jgi:hypothetical protein